MMSEMEKIIEAAQFISSKYEETPQFIIILGSGLGAFAEQLKQKRSINFEDIPHFPKSTVEGHKGQLVIGNLSGISVIVLQGRFHFYEGYSMDQVAFPIRCMLYLKVPNLIVTNASGSVDTDYQPGDLMIITDHINFSGNSPLRGANIELFGPRFNDMSDPYTGKIRALAKDCGKDLDIELKEGVYFYMTGPSYETASEIKAIKLLGAHVVGMSTVPEVLVASHGGMEVLGLSCITNMGTGIIDAVDQSVGHEDVIQKGEMAGERIIRLLQLTISRWNSL